MSKRTDLAESIERNKAHSPLCIVAICPDCDRMVAAHVIDRSKAWRHDYGDIVLKAVDGFRVEIICGPVLVGPCKCDPEPGE